VVADSAAFVMLGPDDHPRDVEADAAAGLVEWAVRITLGTVVGVAAMQRPEAEPRVAAIDAPAGQPGNG
jgi:hypothetical protein